MSNSGRLSVLLVAMLVLSSNLSSAGQNPPRPVKPAEPAAAVPATRRAASTSADPFLGVWKLSAEKSTYEAGGAPKSFIRTYEDRGGGTIFMTTDVSISEGSTRAYLVYRRDGQPYPEAAVGAGSIRMVAVKAVDPRTEELSIVTDGKTAAKPITTTVSADGMTMTQVVAGTNSKGKPFTNTLIYDKQP